MATNRLIQKLFGADETGVGEDSNLISNRRSVEKFRVNQNESIVAGDAVAFDMTATGGERLMCIRLANTGTTGAKVAIGVAAEPGSQGQFIDVVLCGIVEEAKVKGDVKNVAIGMPLAATGADGKLHAISVTGGAEELPSQGVAIAMEASTADGTSRVLVCSPFK